MNRVCSIFAQIVGFIPRGMFEQAVQKHKAEKHAKGVSSWSQFIAVLFGQLGGARSLREIVGGLAASEGKLRHLGVEEAPKRSSLAYANEHRPWQVYKTVFENMVELCQIEAKVKKKRFRFNHPLVSLDSTVIPVCLAAFQWATYTKTKGAVKLHLVLDNATFLPQFAVITDGKKGDVTMAKHMEFAPGTMLVMDRAYEDHAWWRRLTAKRVRFVTRLKDSTSYIIRSEREVPARHAGTILRDEEVILSSEKTLESPTPLRRIEIAVEGKPNLVFITNDMKLAASTIAAIYKDRWQIELFFKAIKQGLRIKSFIGTSENAVQTQIWTALIAMLVVRYLQLRSTFAWGLSNLIALLRQQLFVYRICGIGSMHRFSRQSSSIALKYPCPLALDAVVLDSSASLHAVPVPESEVTPHFNPQHFGQHAEHSREVSPPTLFGGNLISHHFALCSQPRFNRYERPGQQWFSRPLQRLLVNGAVLEQRRQPKHQKPDCQRIELDVGIIRQGETGAMTQEVFPEIHAATQALQQRIALTETEVSRMKEALAEKKRLIKGWKKAINAVSPGSGKKKTAAAGD